MSVRLILVLGVHVGKYECGGYANSCVGDWEYASALSGEEEVGVQVGSVVEEGVVPVEEDCAMVEEKVGGEDVAEVDVMADGEVAEVAALDVEEGAVTVSAEAEGVLGLFVVVWAEAGVVGVAVTVLAEAGVSGHCVMG